MGKIQPIKFQIARKRLGWSMDDLVAQMGDKAVSKMSISKFERGLLKPSEATLQALASACHVDVSYFYQPEFVMGKLHYRYKNDCQSGLAAQYEAKVKYVIEKRITAESFVPNRVKFVHPFGHTVIRSYEDAEKAAYDLRRSWEIGSQPIHSVYEMLEEHGVIVIEADIQCDTLLGLSTFIDDKIPVAVINIGENTTSERKRFTVLHELAHLLLGFCPVSEDEFRQSPIYNNVSLKCPTVERLCHRFAGAMLITSKSMTRRLGDARSELSLPELISIRNMYGISIAALVHRAHDIGIISDKTYDHWYDDRIKKNLMETGWGEYPIMETADRVMMIEEMVKMETEENENE